MEFGKVKWFATKKGFGFIEPENGAEDLFVHQADITMEGFRNLKPEQRVSFMTSFDSGKARAARVVPLALPEKKAAPEKKATPDATPPAKSKARKSPEKLEAAPYPVAAEMAIAEKAKKGKTMKEKIEEVAKEKAKETIMGKKGKKPKTIEWTEAVVPEVIKRAVKQGWEHKATQVNQGHMVILHKPNPNSEVTTMKLNIWCTTGTIGSYLVHPKKNKPTALFRIPATTWEEVEEVLVNPRVHTERGYKKKEDKPEPAATKPAAAEKKGKKAAPAAKPTTASVTPGAQTGKVRFYDARVKFFGFIEADADGKDIHVRRTGIKKGTKLYPGTAVDFVRVEGARGPQARKVKAI